jgi:hypothetical protein
VYVSAAQRYELVPPDLTDVIDFRRPHPFVCPHETVEPGLPAGCEAYKLRGIEGESNQEHAGCSSPM